MNKMELIGNLTKDPETRTVKGINGEAKVTNFTVAANDGFGEHKQTLFVRVTAWNGFGEMCARYLRKGSKVYAAGPVTVNAYINNDGKAVGQLEMKLEDIEFLSRAGDAVPAAEEEEDIEELL
jgi:single-strand DNA-binding protein